MSKAKCVFEKLALSSELLLRAGAKAEEVAKQYAVAAKTLIKTRNFKEAVPLAQRSVKKYDQMIDFTTEGMIKNLDENLFTKDVIKNVDEILPFGGAETRLSMTKDFMRQMTRKSMGHSQAKEVDSLQQLIEKYR